MREVYRPLNFNQPPLFFVDRRTSELIKYAANAFLATKITFINEISDLCEKVGANVQNVAREIGMDNRIGGKFLHAGPGFGGSCFPKDTLALIKTGQDADSPLRVVEMVAAVNDQRKRGMAKKIIAACDGLGKRHRLAIRPYFHPLLCLATKVANLRSRRASDRQRANSLLYHLIYISYFS